jgi:hypothetical protein
VPSFLGPSLIGPTCTPFLQNVDGWAAHCLTLMRIAAPNAACAANPLINELSVQYALSGRPQLAADQHTRQGKPSLRTKRDCVGCTALRPVAVCCTAMKGIVARNRRADMEALVAGSMSRFLAWRQAQERPSEEAASLGGRCRASQGRRAWCEPGRDGDPA